jgi:hypothetical protein
LSGLLNLHANIAADLHAKGEHYKLRCLKCKSEQPCNVDQFAHYLAVGWPQCCERTMSLEK